MAFLLVDEILLFKKGESIIAVKNVSTLKDYFLGHIYLGTILPYTLAIESVAQAAGWLITASLDFKKRGLLINLNMLEFNSVIRPGDQLLLEAEVISLREDYAILTGRAKVDGRVIGKVDSGLCILVDTNKIDDVERTKYLFSTLMKI
ncbi:3-hydroxyacyl-[acyl-carrier-protein] dehydratase FabZ [Chloroflexota bacterium]